MQIPLKVIRNNTYVSVGILDRLVLCRSRTEAQLIGRNLLLILSEGWGATEGTVDQC